MHGLKEKSNKSRAKVVFSVTKVAQSYRILYRDALKTSDLNDMNEHKTQKQS